MTRRQKVDSHYIGFYIIVTKPCFWKVRFCLIFTLLEKSLVVSFRSSIDVLKDWITSLISCEVSATEECFSQAKLRIFLPSHPTLYQLQLHKIFAYLCVGGFDFTIYHVNIQLQTNMSILLSLYWYVLRIILFKLRHWTTMEASLAKGINKVIMLYSI